MTSRLCTRVGLLLALTWGSTSVPATSQTASVGGRLQVTVQDQTGLVIVGAMVEVLADANATEAIATAPTGADGVASFEALPVGTYAALAWFEGFEPTTRFDIRVRANQLRREVITLKVATYAEEVDVARDPRESATDPRGDGFSTVLTERDIEDLPDDPDELAAAIEQAAGPGAVMRVNGFRGGALPPKSQIREIRFRRNTFSAEQHESGSTSVEILTRPGFESWRGNLNVGFRDDAMNARNALAPDKVDEQQRRGGLSLNGPLWKNHTSLALDVDGFSSFDTLTILAVDAGGAITGAVRRPTDRTSVNVRVEHALSRAHVLRGEYQQRDNDVDRLGVGELDLAERAYSRSTSERVFRLGTNGPLTKTLFNDLRLQVTWNDVTSIPQSTSPTIRVSGAFNAGGANVTGGRSQRTLELADNLDFNIGRHALRAGLLFEGFSVDSTAIRNAGGTFTFGSLDDYRAARPITYTVRQGDPNVSYSLWQFAWFLQDDIKLRKDLTLSVGLRHEWQSHLDDALNLAPRVGYAWSPFENGRTSFRGGAGLFYDWYDADTYEQTLQVDGERLTDLVVRSPGFPDPLSGGTASAQPPGVIRQADGMRMPLLRQASFGVERTIGARSRVNVSYQFRDGSEQLRATATNLPSATGTRPDPRFGNITVVDAIGTLRAHSVMVGGNWRADWHRLFVAGNYTLGRSRDDGDGPLSLPADSADRDEWGPSRSDVTHRASLFANMDLFWNFRTGLNVRAESAPPYTITTGFDANGDTIFTDRPEGVGRNSARADGLLDINLRLSWRVGFGQRSGSPRGPGGGPPVVVMRGGGGGDGPGPMGGGPNNDRVGIELYAQAFNLTNGTHLTGYNGVLSSPLFGRASSARPPRRMEIGARVTF